MIRFNAFVILLLSLLLICFKADGNSSSQQPFNEVCYNGDDNWKLISKTQLLPEVEISTFTKSNIGTKLLSFRGDALRVSIWTFNFYYNSFIFLYYIFKVPIHISDAVAHFDNLSLSYDWIDLLKDIKEIGPANLIKNTRVVYQRLHLPWPVSDRELILEKHWSYDHQRKIANFSYSSLTDKEADKVKFLSFIFNLFN